MRIPFTIFFSMAWLACMYTLVPEGYWIYLAGLVASTAGLTATIFIKD